MTAFWFMVSKQTFICRWSPICIQRFRFYYFLFTFRFVLKFLVSLHQKSIKIWKKYFLITKIYNLTVCTEILPLIQADRNRMNKINRYEQRNITQFFILNISSKYFEQVQDILLTDRWHFQVSCHSNVNILNCTSCDLVSTIIRYRTFA